MSVPLAFVVLATVSDWSAEGETADFFILLEDGENGADRTRIFANQLVRSSLSLSAHSRREIGVEESRKECKLIRKSAVGVPFECRLRWVD